MYDYHRRVFVKSQQRVGTITERNYIGRPRHACYVVTFTDGSDYMTGSADLRAADYCCDGCGRWLPGAAHAYAPDGEYPSGLAFCWLCSGPPAQERALNIERREAHAA